MFVKKKIQKEGGDVQPCIYSCFQVSGLEIQHLGCVCLSGTEVSATHHDSHFLRVKQNFHMYLTNICGTLHERFSVSEPGAKEGLQQNVMGAVANCSMAKECFMYTGFVVKSNSEAKREIQEESSEDDSCLLISMFEIEERRKSDFPKDGDAHLSFQWPKS